MKKSKSNKKNREIPWFQNAIYYQIFVERFRNGNTANLPTQKDVQNSHNGEFIENWRITPWYQDWYLEDDYMKKWKHKNFYEKVPFRRYGGDLQGVLEKLDYLENLGITALFFNPLNDAPSHHKYDARHYRHIDRFFGNHPQKDSILIENEIPDDPDTWQWTHADRLFLDLVEACHKRNIKVILDYSWNHTGVEFWAFKDVKKNGIRSQYADWYDVTFDKQGNVEKYNGWWGHSSLPIFKQKSKPDNPHTATFSSQSLIQHIFSVSKRWLCPKVKGIEREGIDGFRLDVAAEMGKDFWIKYRKYIKSLKKDAVLLGEIWWFDKAKLNEIDGFLEGDMFDGIMNYRWLLLAHRYFAQSRLKTQAFIQELKNLQNIPFAIQQGMMNIGATHDTPRLLTMFANPGDFDENNKLDQNENYDVGKPSKQTLQKVKLFLVFQFTYVGSPHIWNGDEMGMWGASDPDCRKPLWWEDVDFDRESHHPIFGKMKKSTKPQLNISILQFYKKIIQIRKDSPCLALGDIHFQLIDDYKSLFSYERSYEKESMLIVFNNSSRNHEIRLPAKNTIYFDLLAEKNYGNSLFLKAKSAVILKKLS